MPILPSSLFFIKRGVHRAIGHSAHGIVAGCVVDVRGAEGGGEGVGSVEGVWGAGEGKGEVLG